MSQKEIQKHKIEAIRDLLMLDLGGPKLIPAKYLINFQKGMTAFYMVFLMYLYQNFSSGCYLYLALHGSYGFIWLLKDQTFPDKKWDEKVSLGSMIIIISGLALYWVVPWMMASGIGFQEPTPARILVCVLIYALGLVLMMCSDAQKYYTLKYKKGLICDGFFKYTRNPNYLGEMMIYWSFANAVGTFVAYCVPAFVWVTIFAMNMFCKELSYRKKEGWDSYKEQSYVLFPRIFHKHILNIIFYVGLSVFFYFDWQYGGYIKALRK